jgi:puromycin-sensitive aminopeptidase
MLYTTVCSVLMIDRAQGFARYMEHLAVDQFFPEFDIWTQFVFEVYGSALRLDALASSHPVEVEVNHPDEINEIFDSISYAKGASIIRMIADFIGQQAFKTGIQRYLSQHLYANVCRALQCGNSEREREREREQQH